MSVPDRIRAPFTDEQVIALNRWQGDPSVHPFTCPADGSSGSWKHSDRRILIATYERWECPRCAYVQHWAHAYMASPTESTTAAEGSDPSATTDNAR